MADISKSTKEQMNDPSNGLVPSKVSRKTVADGSWLQKYTFGKLSARDDFLADQIDGVSGNLASAYDDMVEDITDLQDDVISLSDEIKNMSPLTYRGNGSVTEIKNKTDKRNGDVYSISGLSGSSAKSGVWWIGGTTKQGDDDFKVKNNNEVAYTSATDRWFPIGQDIHVEYSAGENIEITDDNVINISGRVNLNLVPPITGALNGSTYNIGFSPISMTAQHISANENNTDTTNRPLTWYTSETLYYNTGIYVNGDTFYAQNISSNSITGVATSASKINVYNWSSNNNRPIAFVSNTTATSASQYYSDIGIDSTLYFNPNNDTLYSKNFSADNISADYINPKKIYIDNHTVDGEFWLLWSNVDDTENQHLWYTNSAFRVNPQAGRITTPQISSTNISALSASGNSAKFANISGSTITGVNIGGTNIRADSIVSNTIFPLPKYIFNATTWNMGSDTNFTASWDPYCRYFNVFNPIGGSSGHSATCGKYLTFNIATNWDSECTLLSYARGNNAYFNLRLCLSSKSDKKDWKLGMLSTDKSYYENRLTATTANTFNISVGGGYLTTKIIVSPTKKFIVVKGGDCKFQGAIQIQ